LKRSRLYVENSPSEKSELASLLRTATFLRERLEASAVTDVIADFSARP